MAFARIIPRLEGSFLLTFVPNVLECLVDSPVAQEVSRKMTTEVKDEMNGRFFDAAKEVTAEMKECTAAIEKAEADYKKKVSEAEEERNKLVGQASSRREELKVQLQTVIGKMQSIFGTDGTVARKNGKRHEKSVRVLITEYIEKNREARTSEIREFLQSQGRGTNPGVELSRMVRDGAIVNKERGLYVSTK